MKFDKIIGSKKEDPSIILCEQNLSAIFVELAAGYQTKQFGSKFGGDIFLHQLISPMKHFCDLVALDYDEIEEKIKADLKAGNITEQEAAEQILLLERKYGKRVLRTAATNGKNYYWHPPFVNKLSRRGLRLVVGHEGWHSIYMHPQRRGGRNPALWNIAVDYKVNNVLMEDMIARGMNDAPSIFKQELGDYILLEEYAQFLKDPFNAPEKLKGWNPMNSIKRKIAAYGHEMPDPTDGKSLFYAEPKLEDNFRRPEVIYDYLLSSIPKCRECGKLGVYKKPAEYKKLLKDLKELEDAKKAAHGSKTEEDDGSIDITDQLAFLRASRPCCVVV